jgi:hypothetical protein
MLDAIESCPCCGSPWIAIFSSLFVSPWKTLSEKPASYALVGFAMIRKLKSCQFRLYSRKKDPSTGKIRNLGIFATLEKAKQHEREVQYFKRH